MEPLNTELLKLLSDIAQTPFQALTLYILWRIMKQPNGYCKYKPND